MDNLSPEDREILAKTKFKQWFDECWNESFGSAFDGRFNEVASLSSGESHSTGTTIAPTSSGKTADDTKPRSQKRSLFEMAFSDVFGM